MPDLCGLTAGGLDLVALERTISRAIRAFEPRIRPGTLRVIASVDESSMSGKALVFEVRGDLWSQPVPEPLYLKTEVDLETGAHTLVDAVRG